MKLVDRYGRKWRLGRRVLPWRTRASWVPAMLYGGLDLLVSEGFLLGMLLLLFVIPCALMLLVGWLTSVLLAPLYILGQWIGVWRKNVVVYLLRDLDVPRRKEPEDGWTDTIFMRERRYQVYSWPFATRDQRHAIIAQAALSLRECGEPYRDPMIHARGRA